jgi:hypothetical protein
MRYLGAIIALLLIGVDAGAQLRESRPTGDPLAQALTRSDVFVGKTRAEQVQESALRDIASRAPSDRPLKIAVVSALPESGRRYRTAERYTDALHRYLNLGRGTLIIATARGVYASTDSLTNQQIDRVLRENGRFVQTDPVDGIRRISAGIDAAVSGAAQRERRADESRGNILLVGAGALGVGGALWLGNRAARKRRELEAAREPARRLHDSAVEHISYADNYLDLLPASDDAAKAREYRQRASELLEQSDGVMRSARTPEDFGRAEALLEEASELAQQSRHHIDLATGGTGFAVAVEGTEYKATPALTDGTESSRHAPLDTNVRAESIPENERGACFFCSKPARITELTPITVAIEGRRRKVLACDDDVKIIKEGATPEVRTVEEEGAQVPWFNSNRYDPYRDYRREPMYAPGFGNPFGGFFGGLLLGQLLSPGYHAPYPVFVDNSGHATPNLNDTAPEFSAPVEGAGGFDFFGGGSDFGGGDSGSSDFGGSGDFGGGDWSGGDFGGGDFGGGDFGGGGDY